MYQEVWCVLRLGTKISWHRSPGWHATEGHDWLVSGPEVSPDSWPFMGREGSYCCNPYLNTRSPDGVEDPIEGGPSSK